MSKRGSYIGGHSLIYGSSQKEDDQEYWADAKARVDALHNRSQEKIANDTAYIRAKLCELDAKRETERENIRTGRLSLQNAVSVVKEMLGQAEALKSESRDCAVRFGPEMGVGRTYMQLLEMFEVVQFLAEFMPHADLVEIRVHL